eukprot:133163_1
MSSGFVLVAIVLLVNTCSSIGCGNDCNCLSYSSCRDMELTCNGTAGYCYFRCFGSQSCYGATLNCKDGVMCHAVCGNSAIPPYPTSACAYATINGNKASSLTITTASESTGNPGSPKGQVKYATINCPEGGTCSVDCTSPDDTCTGTDIHAESSTSLTVKCHADQNGPCSSLDVFCPDSISSPCDLRAYSLSSTYWEYYGLNIWSLNGFNQVSFENTCTDTYNTGTGTMHCHNGLTGEDSSCKISKSNPNMCDSAEDDKTCNNPPPPTPDPTVNPTYPTVNPTYPSKSPTNAPSSSPTQPPTTSPSKSPTHAPSNAPSDSPSMAPSNNPSVAPSQSPTRAPSNAPTRFPSAFPSTAPSLAPSTPPTANPTHPSANPTFSPTLNPSNSPSSPPTFSPTAAPTRHPTLNPSVSPSSAPSLTPSNYPSNTPSLSPSSAPTAPPTHSPSTVPSTSPTAAPTHHPTLNPSASPSNTPSLTPSNYPSNTPTSPPTHNPSVAPSLTPTGAPTRQPTLNPSASPSNTPSLTPSNYPSIAPSASPSSTPTAPPTHSPSAVPSTSPTTPPTNAPSVAPSFAPTDTLITTDDISHGEDSLEMRIQSLELELRGLQSLYETTEVTFACLCGLLILCALIDAKVYRINDYFDPIAIVSMFIQSSDTISDCFFVAQVRTQMDMDKTIAYDVVFALSIVFIVVPGMTALLQLYFYAK